MVDNYCVIDLETTMNCPIGKNKANPMWPLNEVVYYGSKYGTHSKGGTSSHACTIKLTDKSDLDALGPHDTLYVGHNIKFDLLYLFRSNAWYNRFKECDIWDTQLAEYILTGQRASYASLDECALKYGGTLKDDRMKEFFKAGVGVDKIPDAMVHDYLAADLKNTEIVYVEQRKLADELGTTQLIMDQCRSLLATTYMQFHGFKIDQSYIDEQMNSMKIEIDSNEATYKRVLKEYLTAQKLDQFYDDLCQWSSTKQLSTLFFGGVLKKKEKQLVGTYKNGKDKFKLVEVTHEIKGHVDPDKVGADPTKTVMVYTVDDTVLKNICSKIRTKSGRIESLALLVSSLRELDKQYTTYFLRTSELVMPSGFIHPSLNHCVTRTGRLSCTEPNLQNQTNGPIKKAFVSRWGDQGVIYEVDYNQLEMVGLAYLSNDAQLIADINGGVDLHTALFQDMNGRKPTSDERKWFKRLTFGLVYGAGANTLAQNAGCEVSVAKKFVKTFYSRYSGVAEWHKQLIYEAAKGRYVTAERVGMYPRGQCIKVQPTGRYFMYDEYASDFKDGLSFSPTELKNYPVQSFSTADIVPLVLGKIIKRWLHLDTHVRDHILPILTVHDSVVFDVHVGFKENFENIFPKAMLCIDKYLKESYNLPFDLIPKVGVSCGHNWLEQPEEYDLIYTKE